MSGYDDIINLPHHVSDTHPRMSMTDRAAQFSPFAALTGYGDAIDEVARPTDAQIELTEDERREIDRTLRDAAAQGTRVEITFFVPDARKSGGQYAVVSDVIKRLDFVTRTVELSRGGRIGVDRILDVAGE